MNLTTSIVCPQCGASQGIEYRTNHFICPHCDSKYRWNDPKRKVVQLQQPVCFCGSNSIGSCTDCGTPVCDIHRSDLHDLLTGWQFIRTIYAEIDPRISKYSELSAAKAFRWKRAKPGWLFDRGGLAELYKVRERMVFVYGPFDSDFLTPLLKQVGREDRHLPGILCLNCTEECFVTLGPLLDAQAARFLRLGRYCGPCLTLRKQGDQELCQEVIPGVASATCADCGQQLCRKHQQPCPGCQAPMCHLHSSFYCPDCRWQPWRWFK